MLRRLLELPSLTLTLNGQPGRQAPIRLASSRSSGRQHCDPGDSGERTLLVQPVDHSAPPRVGWTRHQLPGGLCVRLDISFLCGSLHAYCSSCRFGCFVVAAVDLYWKPPAHPVAELQLALPRNHQQGTTWLAPPKRHRSQQRFRGLGFKVSLKFRAFCMKLPLHIPPKKELGFGASCLHALLPRIPELTQSCLIEPTIGLGLR